MFRLRLAACLLCAFLGAAGCAFADGTSGTIYVRVMDARSGRPESGWTVQVTGRDGDIQSITGGSGQATFLSVTPGLTRIDVMRTGKLGACPAVVMVNANEETIVNVHVKMLAHGHQPMGCSPLHAQTIVRPGVTSDVYDIH